MKLLGETSDAEQTGSADIYAHFRGLIVSGRLGSGEKLPTVRQTAADLNVAPGTAARAYKQLERDGLVVSKTGAGTRVSASASLLSKEVACRVRDLVAIAQVEQTTLNDLLSALTLEWNANNQ